MSKNNKVVARPVHNEMTKRVNSGDISIFFPVLYGGIKVNDTIHIENSIYFYFECGCFLAN